MDHAFPEDELRPLTCGPLTRDEKNPEHNDVLGNYTLTLIDSLSTLAILSSSPESGDRALTLFQNGVEDFVRLYGDGSSGPAGQGERARGFDIDSKVQVFETVIRGLGMTLTVMRVNLRPFRLTSLLTTYRWTAQRTSLRCRRASYYRIQAGRTSCCFCQRMGQKHFLQR